ncbi:hypothetical protein NEUTE1DRAFT_57533 [Neurospora tetrasperma FGSC 2508]|uniref:60S ribosomal subunit assembly/export protein LOC1 n=3 Tax=Neurospora TaxID=5140 RepID=A0AAJ0MVE4_9PEZI|nr:uncharacterized protein NEUTE1DRAFT_57533 [Neurospora tetrasperma FGSC 2508]EGO60779.1 hypothetical protein NEUTE1DRAFT_57533 [Neurospora tetrasperma FGSC 2508]EGZ75233.1 hypothetical protein NEUTE2DRAFT_83377 [Neurospora tetrasperma FGSC 2509]KAK3499658.1 hypothetical protein B0T23DRAFT_22962 [Neurospora hispaniola]
MAPTKTIKNKHAANKSGIKGSKDAERSRNDGVLKSKGKPKGKAHTLVTANKGRPNIQELIARKKKKKTYSEKELAIPELNMITPVGVTKPKGKKKGKVFVDDKESMATILAIVQAEKEGQIESKMIKARQMEEIREARRAEAEKKEAERKARLEETKDSLRKKRKRSKQSGGGKGDDDDDSRDVKEFSSAGTKAVKSKKKKSVSFAAPE